jgi:Holliday junction resolvase RusA-like endonuclease
MQTAISFFAAGKPVAQGSMKAFVPKGWNRAIVTHDKRADLLNWRAVVAHEAVRAMMSSGQDKPFDGAVSLRVVFYMPRPKSLSKHATQHIKKPDCSKLVRAVEDALTNVVWSDDSQVTRIIADKVYATERVGCRVEVARLI